eukprot:m.86405 g.86405  ORF g.86405 m.86405 type:complete len:210 (-) comp8430_c0_seq4:181-810(-)
MIFAQSRAMLVVATAAVLLAVVPVVGAELCRAALTMTTTAGIAPDAALVLDEHNIAVLSAAVEISLGVVFDNSTFAAASPVLAKEVHDRWRLEMSIACLSTAPPDPTNVSLVYSTNSGALELLTALNWAPPAAESGGDAPAGSTAADSWIPIAIVALALVILLALVAARHNVQSKLARAKVVAVCRPPDMPDHSIPACRFGRSSMMMSA